MLLPCVILKTFPIYRCSTPTPPEFPAPVTTGAGGCRTAPRPCCGALLLSGPNGLEFHRAPCGSPRFAGSAPLAGPENSRLPWQPGGKEREGGRKWRMTNEEEEDGVQKKKKPNNNDEQKRKNNNETEGEKHVQYSSGTDRKMLALSSLIRDNGQVCSRQIASNTLALTGICKDFASVQKLII